MTLEITLVALLIALVLGFLLALARISGKAILAVPAALYIEVIRAVPVLVIIVMGYYSLPAIGIRLHGFPAACVALGAFYATLYCEIIRGGILGVDRGQREAAQALGMGSSLVMRRIVLPQAVLAILPPATNQLSNLIKDTSLVIAVGVADLMSQAYQSISNTFLPMDMLVLAGIMYFVLYLILSRFLTRWEQRVQYHRG